MDNASDFASGPPVARSITVRVVDRREAYNIGNVYEEDLRKTNFYHPKLNQNKQKVNN